jgi:hypothetical protein
VPVDLSHATSKLQIVQIATLGSSEPQFKTLNTELCTRHKVPLEELKVSQ